MKNLSFKYEPKPINFNIPKHLKYHFDRLVKFKGISRTSVLISLIEGWVRNETQKLNETDKIYEVMSKLENSIERSILRSESKSHGLNKSINHKYCNADPNLFVFPCQDEE